MSDNYIKVTVTGNKSKSVSVKSTELKNQITAGADMSIYYSNKAKEWAISDKLVDNEDYSSKYHANLAKSYTEEGALQIAEITALREQTLVDIETEKQNVIDIGTDQINQVTTISNTAISDIETSKTNALSDIDSAKTIVLEDISTQETQTLNNIRETANVELDKIVGAGIDSRANIDLSNLSEEGEKHFINKSQITNCITEIPQRIKYTLENGTLTLKAGTVLIVPYGTKDLTAQYPIGSTFIHENFKVVDTQYIVGDGGIIDSKFFVWVEVQNDIALSSFGSVSSSSNLLAINLTINSFLYGAESSYTAGTDYTAGTSTAYYDYTINTVKFRSTTTSAWQDRVFSLPVLNFTRTSGVPTAVNKVFNGYGYIGSVRWIDKGIKALFSIGKNPDGTYINEEFVSALRMETSPTAARSAMISSGLTNQMFYREKYLYYEQQEEPTKVAYLMWFNPDTGLTKRCLKIDGVLQWVDYPSCKLYDFTFDGTNYTEFSGKTAFRAADWNETHVKTYVNGTSWYRIHADGWIEQGLTGKSNHNGTKLTLLKPFSNTNYTITLSRRVNSSYEDTSCTAYPTSKSEITIFGKDDGLRSIYACGY